MGRVWVLDTDTKVTGAEMVPLETLLERKRSAADPDPGAVSRRRPGTRGRGESHADRHEDAPGAVEPRPRRGFRLVDALSGRLFGDGVDVRAASGLLGAARSVADLRVYTRTAADEPWRALTLREQQALRALRQD